MKRILPLVLCAAMALSLLSSCAKPGLNGPTPDESAEVSDPIQTEAADGPVGKPESQEPSGDPSEEPSLSLPPETETPSVPPSEEPSVEPTPKPTPTPNPEPTLSLPPDPEVTPEEPGESSAPAGQPDLRQFYENIMVE